MKNLFGTLLIVGLMSTVAIADVIQNDLLKFGQASSGANKVLEFNTNDGANNKKLIINGTTKQGSLNVNELTIGNGVAGDKKLLLDIGAGAANPLFKWDNASTKLQFSNDGTNFKNIGSGSGGAAGFNLMADDNPDFEAGTSSWTASGGSFTAISSGQAFGLQGGRFNASAASQTLSGALKTIVDGLKNQAGSASCYFKTTATDYKLQVFDGSNVLSEMTIAATSDYKKQGLVYTHPASGSIRLRVISASNAADLDIDNCFLGELEKGSVAQASLVASMYLDTTASCFPSRSNTAMGDFGTTAACPGPTVEYNSGIGSPQTTDADLPEFTVNNLPPGTYVAVVEGQMYNSTTGGTTALQLSDGTTASGRVAQTMPVNESNPFSVSGVWTYTSSVSKTFKVQGQAATGDVSLAIASDGQRLQFKLYKFPSAPIETYTFDTIAWHVDANIGGANPGLSSSSISTYTEITDPGLSMTLRSGSAAATIPCSSTNASTGLTCSAGDEGLGVVFEAPRAGKIKVCAEFTHYSNAANGDVAFQLVATDNSSQTIQFEGGSRITSHTSGVTDSTFPHRTCGTFNFQSAGTKTIRLMYEQNLSSVSANQILADADTGVGQRDFHITAEYMDQQVPAPLIPNIVTSGSASPERLFRARLNLSGASCTITSQSGDIASASRTGAGRCQLTLNSGVFSAAPACVVSVEQPGAGTDVIAFIAADTALSSTNVHVGVADTAGTAVDQPFAIHCMGPK